MNYIKIRKVQLLCGATNGMKIGVNILALLFDDSPRSCKENGAIIRLILLALGWFTK